MKRGRRWYAVSAGITVVALAIVLWVLLLLAKDGLAGWHWSRLTRFPRELRSGGGIAPELVNTVSMVMLAECFSAPVGMAVAVWLTDYAPPAAWVGWLKRVLIGFQSIPAIVVGLIVYQTLVDGLGWPLSVGSGTIALAVLNLPAVAVLGATVLSEVPGRLREGSLALGATRIQTVWRLMLPAALPALIDQLGYSWARLAGETAALIFTAGINVGPRWGWFQPGETLAVHFWYVRTEGAMPDWRMVAAATGLVLVTITAGAVLGAKLWAARILAKRGVGVSERG